MPSDVKSKTIIRKDVSEMTISSTENHTKSRRTDNRSASRQQEVDAVNILPHQ